MIAGLFLSKTDTE